MSAEHTPTQTRLSVEQTKGWGGDFCLVTEGADRPLFKAIKPKAYYTDYPPGDKEGSAILSSSLAAKQGRYVATPEIQAEIEAAEPANAKRLALCWNNHDALLAALEELYLKCDEHFHSTGYPSSFHAGIHSSTVEKVRAAIAAAKEGTS